VTVALDRASRSVVVDVAGNEPMVVALDGGSETSAAPGTRWEARPVQDRWSAWERIQ
jgi:hypothetical protein